MERTLVDRADVAVIGGSLMAGDRVLWPDLSHYEKAVAIELPGEIRPEHRPRVAARSALEEVIRAEVDRVVIEWRDQHRRAPVPPIWLAPEFLDRLDRFLFTGAHVVADDVAA